MQKRRRVVRMELLMSRWRGRIIAESNVDEATTYRVQILGLEGEVGKYSSYPEVIFPKSSI